MRREREVIRPIISGIVHKVFYQGNCARATKECNYEEQGTALCEKAGNVPSLCAKKEHDGDS